MKNGGLKHSEEVYFMERPPARLIPQGYVINRTKPIELHLYSFGGGRKVLLVPASRPRI